MVNQARYKNNRSIQFSFGVVMLSCKVAADLIARKNLVNNHYFCFLCLNNHKLKDCPNNYLKCSICQGKHNYLLHEDSNRNSSFLLNANCKRDVDNTLILSVGQQEISNIQLDAVNMTLNSSTSVNNAMPTAKVLLYNNEDGSFLFRALLDSGSESSFISENAINILGLKRCNDRSSLSGISGSQAGITRGSVGLKIGSRFCKDQLTIKAYILHKVTSQILVERVNIKELDYLEGIPLADEDFSKPSECDVILGSDCFFSILRNGRIIGSKGQPIAQSTIFGWVVAGKIQGNCKTSFMQSHLIRVENECNVDSTLQQFWQTEELPLKKISFSEEEEFCENHFKATYKINNEGAGQILQPDIFTLLVRFRVNEIAFTADIKQMYRQILIDPDDQNLQKIVWRKSLDSNIKEYKLSTLTYDARGFHLRKWRSNSRDVLINISKNPEFNEPNVEIHPENCSKALGLIWDSKEDRCIGSSLRLCRLCGAKRSENYQSCDVGRKKQSRSSQAHMYSKTRVVLSWLSSPPRNWKPFVANRTSEILDIIPCKQWRYVLSKENPADLGSRGMSPKDLPDCSLWWEGPQWLSTEEA
ncbi:DUF1758 domain-containing protein [Trichonephila clavipes]|nr:DUF1758 domain-containing protein [Trichonephila clavipes]